LQEEYPVEMTRFRNRLQQWAPALAMVGGLAWITYVILAMLQPGVPGSAAGAPPASRGTLGLAGAALLCLAGALAGGAWRIGLPRRTAGRVGLALAAAGGMAGGVGVASALLMWMPAVAATVLIGTSALAAAALALAVDAGRAGSAWGPFGLLGVLGLFAAAAPTLVDVVPWTLPVHGALVMAIYGFAWVLFGNRLLHL
jgi:hypothetical protein